MGRIPQKDGKGVKGMHPKKLEMDEAQDYPEPGWVELGETLKYGEEDATWRSHGVSRGVRDRYYKQTQPEMRLVRPPRTPPCTGPTGRSQERDGQGRALRLARPPRLPPQHPGPAR